MVHVCSMWRLSDAPRQGLLCSESVSNVMFKGISKLTYAKNERFGDVAMPGVGFSNFTKRIWTPVCLHCNDAWRSHDDRLGVGLPMSYTKVPMRYLRYICHLLDASRWSVGFIVAFPNASGGPPVPTVASLRGVAMPGVGFPMYCSKACLGWRTVNMAPFGDVAMDSVAMPTIGFLVAFPNAYVGPPVLNVAATIGAAMFSVDFPVPCWKTSASYLR